jgi:hypothetical protein
MRAILFSCSLLLSATGLWAQEKEIEIRQAGSFQLDEENFPGANILERSTYKASAPSTSRHGRLV